MAHNAKDAAQFGSFGFLDFLHTHTHNLVTEAEMELIAQIEIKISEECRSTSLTASVK
jgi:hypothetical protein